MIGGRRIVVASLALAVVAVFVHFALEPVLGIWASVLIVAVLLGSFAYAWWTPLLAAAIFVPIEALHESLVRHIDWKVLLYEAIMVALISSAVAWAAKMREQLIEQRAALVASEARFRALTQASFEGLVIHEKGRIVEANEPFAKLLGLATAEDAHGRSIFDFVPQAERQRVRDIVRLGAESRVEIRCQRLDGSGFDAEVIARPITYEGRPCRVAALRDVSDRNHGLEAMRRSDRLAALGTLVAGVAHEINNPLTYIRGNVELNEMNANDIFIDTSLPENTRQMAAAIVGDSRIAIQGLDRISSIVQGLRRIARSGAQARAVLDVNRIVRDVADVARTRSKRPIDLKLDLQSKNSILGSEGEIAQVVLNLCINAVDALETRGSHIHISSRDVDGQVVVEVTDDGPGIPEEARGRLFTPFFTTKASGTGLGLAISHSIAEDHGGRLTFDSRPGRTTFTVALPATPLAVVR